MKKTWIIIFVSLLSGCGGSITGGGDNAGVSISATNISAVVDIVKQLSEAYKDVKPTQVVSSQVPVNTPESIPVAQPDPVIPPSTTLAYEESGNYLGAGNPNAYGNRPLWKFSHPGSYYGANIIVSFDYVESFTITNGSVRTDPIAKGSNGTLLKPGTLWKPVSDEIPPNLVIHGPGGATYKNCTIKYTKK